MYAVLKDGGKNYKVAPGDVIEVEKKNLAQGDKVEFSDVLFYQDDSETLVGTPAVKGAKVEGVVEEENSKGPKVTVFKFKRRKSYRKKQGHRQKYTKIRIKQIVKG